MCPSGAAPDQLAQPSARPRPRAPIGGGDPQRDLTLGLASVLVRHDALDRDGLGAGVVEGADGVRIAVLDRPPPYLARSRQLLVVGVELLVQEDEAPDAD